MSHNFPTQEQSMMAEIEALREERDRLANAIRNHRRQRADDRCIEDDDRLYEALQDGIRCDRRVGDKVAMLANCARFIDRRCEGGAWPSYVQLETALREIIQAWDSDEPMLKEWLDGIDVAVKKAEELMS